MSYRVAAIAVSLALVALLAGGAWACYELAHGGASFSALLGSSIVLFTAPRIRRALWRAWHRSPRAAHRRAA